ncbi:hypothetical protein BH23GEM5_BH23GEM5_01830 [soil metagenome]
MKFFWIFAALFAVTSGHLAAQQRFAVRPEPGTPLVAVELLVATGASEETASQAGVAYVAARAAVRPIRAELESLGARVMVTAEKDAVSFSLLAAPDVWEAATRLLLTALYRDEPNTAAMVAERDAVRAELLPKEGNPANTLTREVDAAVFGPRHPWARPAVGYARTVEKLSAANVDAFMRGNLLAERSWLAVAGPVDPALVATLVRPFLPDAPWQPMTAPETTPARSAIRRNYNYITSWVAASYGFGPEADLPALVLLADLVADQLGYGPTRRAVYDARGEVMQVGDGGEVRFHVVVPPNQGRVWQTRVQDVVASFADQPLSDAAFQEHLRRYRGIHLLRLSSPEARARETARALFRSGGRERTPLALEPVTAERLRAAAQALEPPVLVFLGPTTAGRGD